jgi:hypothetical protein
VDGVLDCILPVLVLIVFDMDGLGHHTTSWQVAGLIPDGVTGIFQ